MSNRIAATLYGLAYGDAVGFPSLFHRFHVLPAKRHDFLFETNKRLSRDHILPLALPFTHRQSEETLAPAPTDDTEFAAFTLRTLLASKEEKKVDAILSSWQSELLPRLGEIWTRFSERAALENLKHGLLPPATGNDNPLHYEDAAVSRAVSIGLYLAGSPEPAAELAGQEAAISQSEDGIWGAQAAAYAVSALAGQTPLKAAIAGACKYFPDGSWISAENEKAEACGDAANSLPELSLLLARNVINNVYSFGNAAPETVPAAFAIVRAADGDLFSGVGTSIMIAKAADSLPPLVGALCGAAGSDPLGDVWKEQLETLRGYALPFMAGTRISELAQAAQNL